MNAVLGYSTDTRSSYGSTVLVLESSEKERMLLLLLVLLLLHLGVLLLKL